MADHQHDYAQHRKELGKQRADELQKSEAEQEKDEQFILDMEKEVDQKHRANAQNQINLEEVAKELQIAEEGIQAERTSLTKRIKDFQDYLEVQKAEEKKEAKQLKMEQDELDMREQQLLNAVEESDGDDDDDRTRQNLSDILAKKPTDGQVSPAKGPALPDLMNEQLQAKLDHMRMQWESDQQVLDEANQQLAEEEGA